MNDVRNIDETVSDGSDSRNSGNSEGLLFW